ncbi:MAG: PAS domain S-box protein [Desulfomonile sp.]|nr:PAS domain S-box protein [Desulfomonile sp.]
MVENRRTRSGKEPPRRNGARLELKKRAARRNATLVKSNKKLNREIAGRARAEQALDIEQQRFEMLAENLPFGMCLIAADGTFDYLNRAFMELFGYDLHDIPDGRTWFRKAFPDPEYRHEVIACWKEDFDRAAPGKARSRIFTVRCQDGIDKIIHFRPVMLPGGDYLMTCEDITELKLAEQELRKSEEKYRGIIEAITDGYHEADLRGNIIFCNDCLCEIVGCSREELLSMNYSEMMDEANAKHVFSAYNRVFRTGKAEQALQFVFTRPDGVKRDVSASVSLMRDADGKPCGFRGIMRDVTEQKRLQEKLHQASKMEAIGRLAGGIAHDFNNLLTAVLGYANVLMQQIPHESRHQKKLIQIVRAAERAAGLTKQLLAFSRKQLLDVRVLDLNEVISGLEEMLHRLIGEDIELTTVYANDLGAVRADVGQVEQILMNLVVNARDAMPDGGELSIETANVTLDEEYARKHSEVTPGPYIMVAVSDTGVGMDQATLARIFDPFFTTKAKGMGTGLGLSTVYGIVKQHHGHVAVYSEPGRGTTFKVYLPRAGAVLEREAQTVAPEPRPVGNETILIVEDAEVVRDLVGDVLGMLGYVVLKAADPEEALRISDSHHGAIHLLLTDVVLPQMDGKSLHRRIASTRPDMKVMYMSGYTDNFIVHHGVLDRDVHFIQKPFSVDNLAKKVRKALDAP